MSASESLFRNGLLAFYQGDKGGATQCFRKSLEKVHLNASTAELRGRLCNNLAVLTFGDNARGAADYADIGMHLTPSAQFFTLLNNAALSQAHEINQLSLPRIYRHLESSAELHNNSLRYRIFLINKAALKIINREYDDAASLHRRAIEITTLGFDEIFGNVIQNNHSLLYQTDEERTFFRPRFKPTVLPLEGGYYTVVLLGKTPIEFSPIEEYSPQGPPLESPPSSFNEEAFIGSFLVDDLET